MSVRKRTLLVRFRIWYMEWESRIFKNYFLSMLSDARILIVDDDADVRTALSLLLKGKVGMIESIGSPEMLLNSIEKFSPDIVILDMNFRGSINSGNEGMFWMNKIKNHHPKIDIVLITAFGDINLAVKAMKEGASEFIVKPWDNSDLLATLSQLSELRKSRNQINKIDSTKVIQSSDKFIGNNPSIVKMMNLVKSVAPTEANVLITGDNGTGKDLLAEQIHLKSNRADKPFVKVDVGTIPESLFESELFGYKKGAFTDAREDKPGRLSEANGGTLFLNEIANLSPQLQAKLLTLIQEKSYVPLGNSKMEFCNFRLICATNAPLNKLVHEKTFRQDLYYRIRTIEIFVPSLADRLDDIERLSVHFVDQFRLKYNKSVQLSSAALDYLKTHTWPGNVRELKHVIERAVILCEENDFINVVHLDLNEKNAASDLMKATTLDEIESEAIVKALSQYNGNISAAAKALGITRSSLYRRIEKHGI